MFKNFNLTSIISIIIISLFVGVVFVYANWTAPLNAPPTCISGNPGCDAPINISSNTQWKNGLLRLLGLTVDFGTNLATQGGNVGIGTVNPYLGSKLDVAGNLIVRDNTTLGDAGTDIVNVNGSIDLIGSGICQSGSGGACIKPIYTVGNYGEDIYGARYGSGDGRWRLTSNSDTCDGNRSSNFTCGINDVINCQDYNNNGGDPDTKQQITCKKGTRPSLIFVDGIISP